MFCPECGVKAQDDAKFCGNCGTNFSSTQSQPVQTSSPAPAKPQYTTSSPATPHYNSGPQGYSPQSTRYLEGEQQYKQHTPDPYYERPEIRSWGNWFLLSIVTFGIANIFYQYFISKDLDRLHFATHDNQGGYGIATTKVNSGEMLLWLFLFPVVFFYKKYNALHDHLKEVHYEAPNIPSGTTYVITWIIVIFTFWMVIPLLIAPFIYLYWEYKWQKAMNQHIRNHGY